MAIEAYLILKIIKVVRNQFYFIEVTENEITYQRLYPKQKIVLRWKAIRHFKFYPSQNPKLGVYMINGARGEKVFFNSFIENSDKLVHLIQKLGKVKLKIIEKQK